MPPVDPNDALNPSRKRIALLLMAALVVSAVVAFLMVRAAQAPKPAEPIPIALLDARAEMATWPWPNAVKMTLHRGVTHWVDRSSKDGTILHLIEFDFKANPGLRFAIYDQDQDDAMPYDDNADFQPNGVGQIAHHLNTVGKGPVIASWNGLFYAGDFRQGDLRPMAHHIGATVADGVVRYNVGNHRWMFGVKYNADRPNFDALHEPNRKTMERKFTYAATGAQCLIHDGKPLKLRPYPQPGESPPPQPVPSTPEEAGAIPGIDYMKTSRISMGWTKDSRKLYLLYVHEPDDEGTSGAQVRQGVVATGGWMLADEQQFWEKFGIWGAVNSDGGNAAQLALREDTGDYTLWQRRVLANGSKEITLGPDLAGAPDGGTLMYFFVSDMGEKDPRAGLPTQGDQATVLRRRASTNAATHSGSH